MTEHYCMALVTNLDETNNSWSGIWSDDPCHPDAWGKPARFCMAATPRCWLCAEHYDEAVKWGMAEFPFGAGAL
jgi:hypothetical protein